MYDTLQGGGFYLLGVQGAGVLALTGWTFVTSFLLLKFVDLVIGLRIPLSEEMLGADLVEHAVGNVWYVQRSRSVIFLGSFIGSLIIL